MTDPSANLILYPSFAMFLLVAVVLARMAKLRVGAIGSGEMNIRFYRTYQEGEEPERLRVVTRHFVNLFEVPTLFHVIVILTYVTGHVSRTMVVLAWTYVGLRYAHTCVHLTSNDVLLRFRLYFGSGIVLAAMWIGLFAVLLTSG